MTKGKLVAELAGVPDDAEVLLVVQTANGLYEIDNFIGNDIMYTSFSHFEKKAGEEDWNSASKEKAVFINTRAIKSSGKRGINDNLQDKAVAKARTRNTRQAY